MLFAIFMEMDMGMQAIGFGGNVRFCIIWVGLFATVVIIFVEFETGEKVILIVNHWLVRFWFKVRLAGFGSLILVIETS